MNKRATLTLILVTSLLSPGAVSAQTPLPPTPVTLAGAPPACDPVDPVVAPLPETRAGGDTPGGGFVAAWSDRQVLVQRFDARGAARGPRLRMGSPAGPRQVRPAAAVAPDGSSAAAWIEPSEERLQAALFSPQGLFDDRLELADGVPAGASLALTSSGDDHFVAVWEQGDGLAFVRFGSTGAELVQQLVSGTAGCRLGSPALAPDRAEPDGVGDGVVLAWLEECPGPAPFQFVKARRLNRFGRPVGPVMELSGQEVSAPTDGPAVTTDGRGRVAAVWTRIDQVGSRLFLDRFEPDGMPVPGARTLVARLAPPVQPFDGLSEPAVASDPAGNLIVSWTRPTVGSRQRGLFVRRYFADGTADGEGRRLTPEGEDAAAPRLAVTGPGIAHVVWWRPLPFPPILPPDCSSSDGIFARRVALGGDHALLLGDGRFRVEVEWQLILAGTSGRGHALPGSDDTGQFWFFDPANVELVTKVLDGREVNGHFWFFYGALSNVGYRITVTDQLRDRSRTYENPFGLLASFADTAAFEALDELE